MHEIRPGAIIGRVFQIYREQAATLLPAALLVYAVQLLAALLVPDFFVVAAVVGIVVGVFYQGMVVRLVEDVQDGRRDHSIGERFVRGPGRPAADRPGDRRRVRDRDRLRAHQSSRA